MYDNFKTMIFEYGDMKKAFQAKMSGVFNEAFKDFFTNYPEYKAVTWTQYTPYFNDGDTCEFNVGDFWVSTSDDDEHSLSGWSAEEQWTNVYEKPSDWMRKNGNYVSKVAAYDKSVAENPRHDEICKAWDELQSLLRSIPDEIFLAAFGDHTSVLATKDGITTEECDHD